MNKLVLANSDYKFHVTSEGLELQEGLRAAGWTLAGYGYDDGCADVPTLLERHQPDVCFVQDFRDWMPESVGCFNPRVVFKDIDALKDHPEFKLMPLKDAGNHRPQTVEDHRRFAKRIGAGALVVYWHEPTVRELQPWACDLPMIRIHHSVDAELCRSIEFNGDRRRGLVSGAINRTVYPIRAMAFDRAAELGIDTIRHPGYSNRGCDTPNFLRKLAGYRVHIATASIYGAALRKIIESVAMGCTPVTDLPEYDRLPEIDEYLIRVPQGATFHELKEAVDSADINWTPHRAWEGSQRAMAFYDFRESGKRLDAAICAAMNMETANQ